MASNQHGSIRNSFYLTVLLAVAIICSVFGFVDYKRTESRLATELSTESNLSVDRLALNLQVPLWNISPSLVTSVVDSELKDPSVARITVLDEDKRTVITSRTKDASGNIVDDPSSNFSGSFLVRKDVTFKNDLVGEVIINYTDKPMRQELREGLLNTAILTILLVVALCLILGISLNKLVISPIIRLSEVSANMASGNFSQSINIEGKGEVATLSANLKRMQTSFQIVVKKLTAKSRGNV